MSWKSSGKRECQAITKRGLPCPIETRGGEFCHVHDPALQCGATKRDGERCAVATGGGRCKHHMTKKPSRTRSPNRKPRPRSWNPTPEPSRMTLEQIKDFVL